MRVGAMSPRLNLQKGEAVEVSSDEEGFRGAWFPATIVGKSGGGYLVEFRDLMTADEKCKLREKANPAHVRPQPPTVTRHHFMLQEKVDAYDQDGWWAGVIDTVVDKDNYLVYFTQTGEKCKYNKAQLRAHLDWVDDKWIQDSESGGSKQVSPSPLQHCKENTRNISSKPERRSNRANKWKRELNACGISGEGMADHHGPLHNAGNQMTEKPGKRKQRTKDDLGDDLAGRRKKDTSGKDMEGVEIPTPSKENQKIDLSSSPAYFAEETKVTFSEAKHQEIKPKLHATSVKFDANGIPDYNSIAEKNIAMTIPYVEYIGKASGCPGDTCEIQIKATLRQIELLAYHSVLKALYVQGVFTWNMEALLTDLRQVLHISNEEHANELKHITSD